MSDPVNVGVGLDVEDCVPVAVDDAVILEEYEILGVIEALAQQ